jgi:hypothetical protein
MRMSGPRFVELVNLPRGGRPLTIRVEPSLPFAPNGYARYAQPNNHTHGGEERGQLIPREERVKETQSAGLSRLTLCLAVGLIVFVLGAVGLGIALYIRVEGVVSDATAALAPHGATLLNQFLGIVNNTALLTANLASTTTATDELIGHAQPLLEHVVNTSSQLLNRLDTFSLHPSIQISGG